MSIEISLAQPPDDWVHVVLRSAGGFAVRQRLDFEEGQRLLKAGMRPELSDEAVRDEVLAVVTTLSADQLVDLSPAARHHVAISVVRVWGLEREWRAMYGTPTPLSVRMRRLLLAAVRSRSRRPTLPQIGDIVRTQATVHLLPVQRTVNQLISQHLEKPVRVVNAALVGALTPLLRVGEQVTAWLRDLLSPVNDLLDSFVRRPAVRAAAELLSQRTQDEIASPIALLLRTHQERMNDVARGLATRAFVADDDNAAAAEVIERPTVETTLVIPDEQTLTAFFVGERADPAWRKGPAGWLLAAVPLPLAANIHALFRESSEAGLAWLAERLLRHELRRQLEPALVASGCNPITRDILLTGLDLYSKRCWGPADTLLTTGLDGLLFDLALSRGVLTPSHRLARPDGKPGKHVTTAGDTRLLSQLSFSGSEIAYLTTMSLGKTGNAPRHGSASPLGPARHAAGSLLGILLVLAHVTGEPRMVARALLGR